ncbi:hypothetical protein IV37_GL001113 [Fructilactobacillus fructivorans]|nr:hypothetical protein IV37_GL001113 [Fructilactobacillus fructivorans]
MLKMNKNAFTSRISLLWTAMAMILFGTSVVEGIQEIIYGFPIGWIDWVLIILSAICIVVWAVSLFIKNPTMAIAGEITQKQRVWGGVVTLVVFLLVIIGISHLSVMWTDLILILGFIGFLLNEVWTFKK